MTTMSKALQERDEPAKSRAVAHSETAVGRRTDGLSDGLDDLVDRLQAVSGCPDCAVQAKLTVGPADDIYEREADHVARRIHQPDTTMASGSARSLRRHQQMLDGSPRVFAQARLAETMIEPGVESAIQQARGGGHRLPEGVRSKMEGAFGASFSGVRIHDNAQADQLNRSLGARAFTTGDDVFFRGGQYSPGSRSGQELLAHELTHVVQQGAAEPAVQRKLIGTVHSATKLREDINEPDTRTGIKKKRLGGVRSLQPNDDVFEIIRQDLPGIEEQTWIEVKLLAGGSLGAEGYLKSPKTNKARPYGEIPDNELTEIIVRTGLYENDDRTKKKLGLDAGILIRLLTRPAANGSVRILVLSGPGANKPGWVRASKVRSTYGENLSDLESGEAYHETEEATKEFLSSVTEEGGELKPAEGPRAQPENLLGPESSPAEVKTFLEQYRAYVQSEIEVELVTQKAAIKAKAELSADTSLPPAVTNELSREVDKKAAEKAAELDSLTSKIRFRISDLQNVPGAEAWQAASQQAYEQAMGLVDRAQEDLNNIKSDDASVNPILAVTLPKAREAALKKDTAGPGRGQRAAQYTKDLGKEALKKPGSTYGPESVANARITGSPAELGGGFEGGVRTVVGSEDSYKERSGTWTDNPFRAGEYDKDSYLTSDKDITKDVAMFFTDHMMGKFWDPRNFGVTATGFILRVPKIFFVKPYPPLAQIEFPIPLFPGIGLSFTAKAKASASVQSIFEGVWGDTYFKKKEAKRKVIELTGEWQRQEDKFRILALELRDENAKRHPDPAKIRELNRHSENLTEEMNRTQRETLLNQKQAAKTDIEFGISGKNTLDAGVSGEFFAGVMAGIPLANVAGGFYGELGAAANADVGFAGRVQRKDGKWTWSLKDDFLIQGVITAEVGAKLSLNILFFSSDLAKFTFSNWTIASFGLGGELDVKEGVKITKKEVKWFDKTRPPIETQVSKAREKADTKQEKLLNALAGTVTKPQLTEVEQGEETNYDKAKSLEVRFSAKVEELAAKKQGYADRYNLAGANQNLRASIERQEKHDEDLFKLKKDVSVLHRKLDAELVPLEEMRKRVMHLGRAQRSSKSKLAEDEAAVKDYLRTSYELRGEAERQSLPLYKEYEEKRDAMKKTKAMVDNKQEGYQSNESDTRRADVEISSLRLQKTNLETRKKTFEKERENIVKESDTRIGKSSTEGFKQNRQQRVEAKARQLQRVEGDLRTIVGQISTLKAQKLRLIATKKAFEVAYAESKKAEEKFDKVKKAVGEVQALIVRAQSHVDRAAEMAQNYRDVKTKLADIVKLRQSANRGLEQLA